MTARFFALSALLCACGNPPPQAASAPPPLVEPAVTVLTEPEVAEPSVAEVPVAEVEAPVEAEASEAPALSAEACEAHAWEVVARDLEQTLREFEELEPNETLSLRTPAERERRCVQQVTIPDLDGDGREEMDLSVGCRWNKIWPHMLFLSTGCRFAGQVWSADSFEYLPRGNAMPDLATHSATGCAGWDFVEERYQWNGTRYESAARVICDMCEDPGEQRGPQPAACDGDELRVRW